MSDPQAATPGDVIESASGTMDLIARAAQDGAADAAEAARKTWEVAGRSVNKFIYTTCYTISYGVVFPSVLLARSIPVDNAAVRGMIDGAHAAKKKLDELGYPALPAADAAKKALSSD
jgi:hypothetical protein